MLKVIISKIFIVGFVGSVTLWYFITPYVVKPHKRIIDDLLTHTSLTVYEDFDSSANVGASKVVTVENWTKWRLFVKTDDSTQIEKIIYGSSSRSLHIKSKAVITMEWRSDYKVVIEVLPEVVARIEVPSLSFSEWGIYDHFFVTVDAENVVKIVPKFLFGIPPEVVESMYAKPAQGQPDILGHVERDDIVGRIPIIGLFSSSNIYDRVIIQLYMCVVIFSIVFLLVANNPPDSLAKSVQKKIERPIKSKNELKSH